MMVAVFGFNYVPVHAVGSPAISRISPTSVPIDSTYDATRVIIYGLNFDQDSYVAFDGIRGIAINPDSQSATGLYFMFRQARPLVCIPFRWVSATVTFLLVTQFH